jgi:drug/metabolite transporter (DMT)-like permease
MKETLAFLAVAALGNVVYHLGQKTIPQGANPMFVLMVVYGLAFVLCAAASPFFGGGHSQLLSWPVVVLAVGVVLIEIGFLLAYRTGSVLQWSGVAVNGAAALLLIPIALVVFRESFTAVRGAGIVLTLTGLVLLAR